MHFSPQGRKRLICGTLFCATLWSVAITSSSTTPAQAFSALETHLALQAVQWELSPMAADSLDMVSAMTIAQSPWLSSARPRVAMLWQAQESDPPTVDAPITPAKKPVTETPVTPAPNPAPVPSAPGNLDNGIPARTLVAKAGGDYLWVGNVAISNTSAMSVTAQDVETPFSATFSQDAPQILILHTHGTEAYTPAGDDVVYSSYMRTLDNDYNVIAAGDVMAQTLGEMGFSVLHDRTAYDYPSYSESYSRSLSAMESYLVQYPSISVILDVHRDAIEDENGNQYKLTTTLDDGRTAAQLSLVMGSSGGGLSHPHWLENLRLAVAVGQQLSTTNTTLLRPILLRDSRYNQHMTTGNLLVEVGAAGNSPEEAALAAELFAQALGQCLLNGENS